MQFSCNRIGPNEYGTICLSEWYCIGTFTSGCKNGVKLLWQRASVCISYAAYAYWCQMAHLFFFLFKQAIRAMGDNGSYMN